MFIFEHHDKMQKLLKIIPKKSTRFHLNDIFPNLRAISLLDEEILDYDEITKYPSDFPEKTKKAIRSIVNTISPYIDSFTNITVYSIIQGHIFPCYTFDRRTHLFEERDYLREDDTSFEEEDDP